MSSASSVSSEHRLTAQQSAQRHTRPGPTGAEAGAVVVPVVGAATRTHNADGEMLWAVSAAAHTVATWSSQAHMARISVEVASAIARLPIHDDIAHTVDASACIP